jgi:hypothetical protein
MWACLLKISKTAGELAHITLFMVEFATRATAANGKTLLLIHNYLFIKEVLGILLYECSPKKVI